MIINESKLKESSFESNGSTYKAAFGHYSKDGESISRDDYFKAKEQSVKLDKLKSTDKSKENKKRVPIIERPSKFKPVKAVTVPRWVYREDGLLRANWYNKGYDSLGESYLQTLPVMDRETGKKLGGYKAELLVVLPDQSDGVTWDLVSKETYKTKEEANEHFHKVLNDINKTDGDKDTVIDLLRKKYGWDWKRN